MVSQPSAPADVNALITLDWPPGVVGTRISRYCQIGGATLTTVPSFNATVVTRHQCSYPFRHETLRCP